MWMPKYASVHVGGVQQSFLPVGEGHIQIPHEGDDAHLIGGGIDTEDHHAVRAHLFLVILPPVLADQQDILDLIVTDDIRLRVRADKLHVLFLLQGILGGQLLRHASLGSGRRCRFGGIEVFRKGFHLMGLRSHFLFGTAASGEEQAEGHQDPQQQGGTFLSHAFSCSPVTSIFLFFNCIEFPPSLQDTFRKMSKNKRPVRRRVLMVLWMISVCFCPRRYCICPGPRRV